MKRLFTFFAIFVLSAFSAAAGNMDYAPGSVIPKDVLSEKGIEPFFFCIPIPDDVFEYMRGKSYKDGCPVPREDLQYVRCLHKDKYGNTLVGEMVVNVKISEKLLSILRNLYAMSYPIEKMRLIDCYGADDEASMRSNNSSGFNYRKIAGSDKISTHGYGLAVDINPLYNPYHKVCGDGSVIVEPLIALAFTDRSRKFDYKIERGDCCYNLFIAAGFKWGGDWKSCKDYQHFEYAGR